MKPLVSLKPLSWGYSFAVRVRNAAYDSGLFGVQKVDIPVVCVGNVAVGGSGKTPFAQYLARTIAESFSGCRPGILLRGYGGKKTGPHLVDLSDSPESVGDEAVLHRRLLPSDIPVVVSRNRVQGARFLAEQGLANFIILDDGLQHRSLNRNLDLLLFDSADLAGEELYRGECLLPAGRLREPVSAALKRAHALISVNKRGNDKTTTDNQAFVAAKPLFHFNLTPAVLRDWITGEEFDLSWLREKSVRALSGLARNDLFRDALVCVGAQIQDHLEFPDHWIYTEKDWKRAVSTKDLPVITTAKDAVKLVKFARQPSELMVLELQGALVDSEWDRLKKVLLSHCGKL